MCDALGYKQTHKAVDRHVDEGDGMKRPTPTTSGIQQMLYVNESGYIHIAYDAEECNTWPFI